MAPAEQRQGPACPGQPRRIGVSLQPAIPRRVAPQQSPLPLRRSCLQYTKPTPARYSRWAICPQFLCLTRGVQSNIFI